MPRLSTLAVFFATLATWYVLSVSGWVSPFLLPSPHAVLETFAELAGSGMLARHALVSLRRVVSGYLLAIAFAVPVALLFSLNGALRRAIEPLLEFLRQIPPLAMMPLLILWLGIGEAQKIGIIVLSCFFSIFLGVRGGVAAVDRKLIDVGIVYGFSRAGIMLRIVLPSALPSIVVGLRVGLGYSWRALVGAELIASSAGLGYMIVDAENLARTDIVLAGILVIGVLGLISDHLLRYLIRRRASWLSGDLEMARA